MDTLGGKDEAREELKRFDDEMGPGATLGDVDGGGDDDVIWDML